MEASDDDRIDDRVNDNDLVKEKEEDTFKHLRSASPHSYFSATDETWHIALRLVVHTEAVGTPQSTCAVSYLNDSIPKERQHTAHENDRSVEVHNFSLT